MLLLAYYHRSLGSEIAHTAMHGLIYRLIWSVTRGLSGGMLLFLVVFAVAMLWVISRR